MMGKPDISKVIPSLARQALLLAGGDRKAAYSRYIQLYFSQTGRLAPAGAAGEAGGGSDNYGQMY